MKVYFELHDICDIDGILGRVNIDSSYYNHRRTMQLCYMFVSEYAKASLEQIVKYGLGVGFVTFVPPDQNKILNDLRNLWPEEDILGMRISFDAIYLHDEIRFFEIQQIVQSVVVHTGVGREAVADRATISLFMNDIGNALICMEC